MAKEKDAKQVILEILDKAEFVLNGLDFKPEVDKNGDLVEARVDLSLVLVDKEEGNLSAKEVIEKYTIEEDETLESVLSSAEDEGDLEMDSAQVPEQ